MPLSIKQEQFDKQLDLTQMRLFRKTSDAELLKQLYAKYIPLVYGLGLKYLNDRVASRELIRKVFDRLTVEASKYEITNLRTWLYFITKAYCSDGKTDTGAEKVINIPPVQTLSLNELELHPLDRAGGLSASVKNCIQKLSDEQRKCIELFYFRKQTYNEIASTISCSEQDVRLYIKKGKQNITNCLKAGND